MLLLFHLLKLAHWTCLERGWKSQEDLLDRRNWERCVVVSAWRNKVQETMYSLVLALWKTRLVKCYWWIWNTPDFFSNFYFWQVLIAFNKFCICNRSPVVPHIIVHYKARTHTGLHLWWFRKQSLFMSVPDTWVNLCSVELLTPSSSWGSQLGPGSSVILQKSSQCFHHYRKALHSTSGS